MKERILLVDDDKDTLEMLKIILEEHGYEITCASNGQEALQKIYAKTVSLVISDIKMPKMDGLEFLSKAKKAFPDIEIIIMTAFVSVESAIEAMRSGAYDYMTKPITDINRMILVIEKALEKSRVQSENRYLKQELHQEHQFDSIIGKSPAMKKVFNLIKKVAATDTSVLIEGESGTGKELVARAIHFNSLVRDCRFVPVDCGLIPSSLLESELFGHVKGAFTGAATDKIGLIEEADGGTLFLDEIADTETSFQAKLLRVIQEREIKRIGETKTRKINTRFITATNRALDKEVAENKFRKDLYYRIKIIHIKIPPLRDRKEDILLLAGEFVKKFTKSKNKKVTTFCPEAIKLLLKHNWPGNVRELQNAVEHAVTLCAGDQIMVEDLPEDLATQSVSDTNNLFDAALSYKEAKENFECQYLTNLLAQHDGNVSRAATASGIVRQNLQKKLKQFKIARP